MESEFSKLPKELKQQNEPFSAERLDPDNPGNYFPHEVVSGFLKKVNPSSDKVWDEFGPFERPPFYYFDPKRGSVAFKSRREDNVEENKHQVVISGRDNFRDLDFSHVISTLNVNQSDLFTRAISFGLNRSPVEKQFVFLEKLVEKQNELKNLDFDKLSLELAVMLLSNLKNTHETVSNELKDLVEKKLLGTSQNIRGNVGRLLIECLPALKPRYRDLKFAEGFIDGIIEEAGWNKDKPVDYLKLLSFNFWYFTDLECEWSTEMIKNRHFDVRPFITHNIELTGNDEKDLETLKQRLLELSAAAYPDKRKYEFASGGVVTEFISADEVLGEEGQKKIGQR